MPFFFLFPINHLYILFRRARNKGFLFPFWALNLCDVRGKQQVWTKTDTHGTGLDLFLFAPFARATYYFQKDFYGLGRFSSALLPSFWLGGFPYQNRQK